MTTYDDRRDPQPDEPDRLFPRIPPALIPGLVLVGIGVLFLLNNLQIVHASSIFAYWPVILTAFGMVKLVDSLTPQGRILGGLALGAGGLILADNLGYLHFNVEDLWPLILIGAGLMMLWDRTHGRSDRWWVRRYRHGHWSRRHGYDWFESPGCTSVHEFALFSGSRRVVTDQDFKGGRLHCVFGGVNLDLTGANMTGNSAVLDVSAVYGGAVIRIPTTWNVEIRGGGVFGGFSDQTMHPPASPDRKRLIVRGGAVFGGVTIKN
jgi:hypothetical protein